MCWLNLLLLKCGDVEANPGPPRRSLAGKAPSTDEKIESLSNSIQQYEAKVSGLENELDSQRKQYEDKIKELETKLSTLNEDVGVIRAGGGEAVESMKSSVSDKLEMTENKLEEITKYLDDFKADFVAKHEVNQQKLSQLEGSLESFRDQNHRNLSSISKENYDLQTNYMNMDQRVKEIKVESSGKLQALSSATRDQRREYKAKFVDMDVELQRMRDRMETIGTILDDMHEKMYDFEQNKRNNLIFYGVRNRPHENPDSLKQHISNLFRDHLNIRREIPVSKASRVYTGPEVRGVRPVLVTFETYKDRETVMRQARALKKANIDVTEDFSKKTRENRQELRKFMRKVKRSNPEKNCFIEYDKLYIDHKIYVYSDALGQVIEQTEYQRYADPSIYSRPGTQMMMMGGAFGDDRFMPGASRPPSGMSTHARMAPKSASAIPRLPPLNRGLSMSTGSVQQIDPRDEKLDEMERMVASYQEKLDSVTNTYQEKVNILENRLVDKDLTNSNGHYVTQSHHQQYNQDFSDFETDAEEEPASPVMPMSQESKMNQIQSIPEEDPISISPVTHPDVLKESSNGDIPNTVTNRPKSKTTLKDSGRSVDNNVIKEEEEDEEVVAVIKEKKVVLSNHVTNNGNMIKNK